MRTTTADYKAAIYATDRECRGYIKFNNDGTKIIRGVDGLISITLHEQLCDEERPMMNCACSRYVEVEFFNSGLPGGVSLANSYIDAYMGVVTKDTGTAPVGSIEPDTATVEYIWNGRFFITEIDRGKLSTKVLAYDELSKLNKQYVPTVTKGVSGYSKDDILVDILTQCGFTSTTAGVSGNVDELYECTCRQMFGWIMGTISLGCNVAMSRTNATNWGTRTITTGWNNRNNADREITDNEIYLGGLADGDTFTISSVTTGTADNPIVAGSGTGLVGENPYLTQANATTIYNNVNGISFKPMTIEFRGNPAIDTGDVLKVTSGGTSNYCYVQKILTTFNGGIKQKIECFGDSAFYYSTELSPTASQIKNAVSSMAQEIQQEIETADNGVITKVLDLDGSWKELVIANNQDLSAATSVWRWNINGLAHSTAYSGGTYNFAVDMNGRIIADVIQTGILQDALGNNSWNLDTGAFSITNGSINVTTNSGSTDVITLQYGDIKTTMSPFTFRLMMDNDLKSYEINRYGFYSYQWSNDLLSAYPVAFLSGSTLTLGGSNANTTGFGMLSIYDEAHKTAAQIVGGDGTYPYFKLAVGGTNRIYVDVNDGFKYFDTSGNLRSKLRGDDSLTFYNSSGTVTATYPATGIKKSLTSGDDLNTLTGSKDNGEYLIGNGVTNAPLSWGGLLNISSGSAHQLAYNRDAMYVRSYTGSPLAWQNWKRIDETFASDIKSKNLLKLSQFTIFENYGVKITPQANGTFKITGVCTTSFNITLGTASLTAGEKYYLSGATGGSSTTAFLNIQSVTNDTGSGSGAFTVSSSADYGIRVIIAAGATNLNLTFSPMVREYPSASSSFAPWVPTPQDTRLRYLPSSKATYLQNAGTASFALNQGVYLLSIGRWNTTYGTHSGLYLIISFPTGSSAVRDIVASQSATVTIDSGGILTVTTTTNYCELSIIQLN